jgi:hypothetical protein
MITPSTAAAKVMAGPMGRYACKLWASMPKRPRRIMPAAPPLCTAPPKNSDSPAFTTPPTTLLAGSTL